MSGAAGPVTPPADPQDGLAVPLQYRPRGRAGNPPNPVIVLLLAVPGVICWAAFFNMTVPGFLPQPVARALHALLSLVTYGLVPWWFAAVATAIASLLLCRRRTKPWYVWVNFAVNIPGLLFTLLVLLITTSHLLLSK
jgi:hypothetical protein